MTKLILTRHGQSVWNAENRFTGWVDVDLSEKGVLEAEKSGQFIKDLDINLSIFSKSKEDIHIRTYENGTGETLSCGSAALCVASKSLTKNKVKIISMGGELSFKGNKNGILMTGPSNFIYQGATNE